MASERMHVRPNSWWIFCKLYDKIWKTDTVEDEHMREIIINRPKRFECSANALHVEVNGKRLAKLKNGQRIVMTVDDAAQEIRVRGGFLCGKAFQDKLSIPAGTYSYTLQVDFVSSDASNYLPVLRPAVKEWIKDDSRTVTLMGAELTKLLLDTKFRESLKALTNARLHLMILPTEWRLVLYHDAGGGIVYRSEYAKANSGLAGAIVNALEHGDLGSAEGRAKICDKVLRDYACGLPEYVRIGEHGIALKA